jgi:hypothetical protein
MLTHGGSVRNLASDGGYFDGGRRAQDVRDSDRIPSSR